MTTSKITRNYWIDKAKGWAEAKLSPPQADEFNSVMDELVDEDEAAQKEIDELKKALEITKMVAHKMRQYSNKNETDVLKSAHKSGGKYTRGGNGSHWEGCENVHYDCKIVQLEAQLKAVTDAAKELYARLYLNFVIVDSPLETEEYIRNTIIKYKLYEVAKNEKQTD